MRRISRKIAAPYGCQALLGTVKCTPYKGKLRASVQSIMGATLTRLSICFIQGIFFVIVGAVKYRTDKWIDGLRDETAFR